MNSDEAKSYFEEHRRLYQILQMRFNKVRLENLFKNVEPTSRGMTKFNVKLMDEFSDFAAEVYQDYWVFENSMQKKNISVRTKKKYAIKW